MFADRIEAKWIDAFCEIFERCAVKPADTAAILSETQSRALNVHLAELALALILMLYRDRRSLDVSLWQDLREADQEPTLDTEPLPPPPAEEPMPTLTPSGRAPARETEDSYV